MWFGFRHPMVSYEYDAWGNTVSVTDNSGANWNDINPFRYRGYYYDTETGLYYLGSRYYNPEVGRFLNSDAAAITTVTPLAVTDKNLFAYCDNNPIMRADDGGCFWNVIIGAVVGGAIGAIGTAISGGTKSEVLVSLACGLISGAFAATGFGGVLGQVAVGAVTSFIDSGVQNYNDYKSGDISIERAVATTVVDTIMGATFGAMGAEGTSALKNSNKISKNAHKAIKTALFSETLHPNTKIWIRTTLRKAGKYVRKETVRCVKDGVSTAVVGKGVSWACALMTP